MDFKGIKDRLAARHGTIYPLSILDDHSRFLIGLFALAEPTGAGTLSCLERAFERYGVPESMLMDHGTPWWSTSNGHGLTQVSVALMKQGIQLYFSGIGHPQTQGKVERLHRTMEESILRQREQYRSWEAWSETFRQEYNHLRPHQALAMEVPAARYQRSTRRVSKRSAALGLRARGGGGPVEQQGLRALSPAALFRVRGAGRRTGRAGSPGAADSGPLPPDLCAGNRCGKRTDQAVSDPAGELRVAGYARPPTRKVADVLIRFRCRCVDTRQAKQPAPQAAEAVFTPTLDAWD
jgi:Integrase core domain